ncbi:MAG: sortase [Chloroflexi bacterium]|nr:MAG: sortase [Chloroflexota bacterium]MBL1195277.1 sortase [Chloroflexota bacterium]NOH12561.1 sortase [Chloroflexota bacterium]
MQDIAARLSPYTKNKRMWLPALLVLALSAMLAFAPLFSDGILDPEFNDDGLFVEAWGDPDGDSIFYDVAMAPGGKIIAVGDYHPVGSSSFAIVRLDDSGHRDKSFGPANNGRVIIDVDGQTRSEAFAVVPLSDGRILVGGTAFMSGGLDDFAVIRLTADGLWDKSFGVNGVAFADITGANSRDASVAEMLLMPDGRILVVGNTENPGGFDFALAMFNPDGSIDSGFGTGGTVATNLAGIDIARGALLQPDGKILVGGNAGGQMIMARYNSNGSLDSSFGTGGIVIYDPTGSTDRIRGIVYLGGKIFTIGPVGGGAGDFDITRFNLDGSVDASFGTGGTVSHPQFNGTPRDAMVYTGTDTIIAVGQVDTDPVCVADQIVVRYNFDGSLYKSGNENQDGWDDGWLRADFNCLPGVDGNDEDVARAVTMDTHERIIIAGYADYDSAFSLFSTVARFQGPDDVFDKNFTTIGSAGGLVRCAKWSIYVPAGVVPDGSQLSCTYTGNPGSTQTNLRFSSRYAEDNVIDITIKSPGGELITTFTKPLDVCYHYDATDVVNAGGTAGNLMVATSETAWRWEPLPGEFNGQQVCGQTTHLSFFGSFVGTLPATGFAPNVVTELEPQPAEKAYTALGDLWLEIPKLGVEMPIVGVPMTGDGWDVTWLGDQAGYLDGTAFPTWAGNTAITGHVWDANNQAGPFAELNKLQSGDRFYIHAYGSVYTYEVRSYKYVRPTDLSVLPHEDYDWVTLLTCNAFDETRDGYTYRLAVRAVLLSVD